MTTPATQGPIRTWFCIVFAVTALIAYSIILLRQVPVPPGIFHQLFLFQDFIGALVMLGVVLAGLVPAAQAAGLRLAQALGDRPVAAAVATTAALAIGARFAYLAHPLSMDEYAPVFQSQAFAAGRWCGGFPPALIDWLVPARFQNVFFVASHQSGCVASAYWPGFALLLTPFSAVGLPWLCNPVIGGLTVLVLHRLAAQFTGDRAAAGLVILLAMASPAFTINAISFYSMPAHLLFNAVFLLCLLRLTATHAFLAGLAGGWALILHNPFPHALFAAPFLLWLLWQKGRFRLIAAVLAGYAPFVLGGLSWVHHLQELKAAAAAGATIASQSPAPSALQALWGAAGRIFRFPGTEVILARAIGLAKLWLWATPGIIVAAVAGWRAARSDVRLRLLFAAALTTFAGYLFYPEDQGHGWGFRYFHSAWLVLPLLAIAGLSGNGDATAARGKEGPRKFLAGCAIAALVVMNPLRAYQAHDFIAGQLAQMPAGDARGHALQIINASGDYYAADLVQNDPYLRGSISMISRGRTRDWAMVAEHFPRLELLSEGPRGTVWGYGPRATGSGSTAAGVGGDQHREQE